MTHRFDTATLRDKPMEEKRLALFQYLVDLLVDIGPRLNMMPSDVEPILLTLALLCRSVELVTPEKLINKFVDKLQRSGYAGNA